MMRCDTDRKLPRFAWALITLLAVILSTSFAAAHDARPVVVHIQELSDGTLRIEWRTPKVNAAIQPPTVRMPEGCPGEGETVRRDLGDSWIMSAAYRCPDSIAGETVSLHYSTVNPGLSTLFRATLQDGTTHSRVMPPGQHAWRIPKAPTQTAVARDYTALGIRHILEGYDHLLFVVCLLLLARTIRRTLITITGFTIGHSLTLALSTLQIVQLPVIPVETLIALSILFLAAEIARGDRHTLTQRFPLIISTGFGLLHGFGFATVLSEIGLPASDSAVALLFFNVGVEIGQVVFILLVCSIVFAVAKFLNDGTRARVQPLAETLALYAIGAASAFWSIERIAGMREALWG